MLVRDMHAYEHLQLAALAALHGPLLVHERIRIPDSFVEQYWSASKERLDFWAGELRRAQQMFRRAEDGEASRTLDGDWSAVLEEILFAEPLVRVWTAVLHVLDRTQRADQLEPVARGVLLGFLEMRFRVLCLLEETRCTEAEPELRRLDGLRRHVERWNDMLIGALAIHFDVAGFALDARRAEQYANDFHELTRARGQRALEMLLQASIRASFDESRLREAPSAPQNEAIGAAVLSCLDPNVFDGIGRMRSMWAARLSAITDETTILIDEILACSSDPAAPSPAAIAPLGWSQGDRKRLFQ